jgi:hypothetical protein
MIADTYHKFSRASIFADFIAVSVSSMALSGWRPCASNTPTKGNRWFVIMGIIATFVGASDKGKRRMQGAGIQVEAFVRILSK